MNNRLLKLIAGTFIIFSLFLLSANITFAQTSSCQHISGDGPIKIVFLKDKRLPLVLDEYKKYAGYVISGFSSVDPFKKYFNKFSFYLDTKDRDGDSERQATNISDSSCGNDAREYIYFDFKVNGRSFTIPGGKVVYVFDESLRDDIFPNDIAIKNAAIHESGHLFGNLNDEYEEETKAPSWFLSRWLKDMINQPFTNCSSNPSVDYKNTVDGKLYGSTDVVGCSYQSDMYYRPDKADNIMRFTKTYHIPFNVVSCGYVTAGILGESVSKSSAQTHWSECCKLDTINFGVPGCEAITGVTFPPAPENCLVTDFTNEVETVNSSDSAVIITAEQDIILPSTEQEGFFKINGTDVSKPDGSGWKRVPSDEQLAIISAGGAIKIEMSDVYCRGESIELQAEVQPINPNSPIKSVSGQSVQDGCAIIVTNGYDGSSAETSFSTAVSNIISDAETNYKKKIEPSGFYITPQDNSAETNANNINSQIGNIFNTKNNTKVLVTAHSIAAIGAFNHRYTPASGKLDYLLYDPPYNANLILWGTLAPPTWFTYWSAGEITTARSNEIASYTDIVTDWSKGYPNNDDTTKALHTKFRDDPNALSKVKDWVIENCPSATSSMTVIIPSKKNCIADPFLTETTQSSSDYDTLISVEEDILLEDISLSEGEENFLRINGIDVSVPDGFGGRKIPKGDLIAIPANTEVTYETVDKYCREGDFTLPLIQSPISFERPFTCFLNCKKGL